MYCTIADLRAEGVQDPPEGPTDARLTQLITEATAYIDFVTQMWFEERVLTLALNGNGRRVLPLHIPIRAVTEARLESEVVDAALYVVYNRVSPDDRPNPRVVYKRLRTRPTVFQGDVNPRDRLWTKGELNVELDGTFGYVDTDPDGTNPITPLLISRACARLVIRAIPLLTDTNGSLTVLLSSPGALQRETTDGHSYSVTNAGVDEVAAIGNSSVLGLTGDPSIDTILLKYIALRPRGMEVV